MNKAERHRRKMVRFRRRLRNYGLDASDGHHSLRSHGRPCSCMFCDPHKHSEGDKHSIKRAALHGL